VLTTGTPTPLPGNVQTATATPIAVAVQPLASPTLTATPSPTPQAIPASLMGKIIFLSDREGATEEERERADRVGVTPQVTPQPYIFDPATGQLEKLTARWPYDVAVARDGWSADTAYETYAQQLLWTNVEVKQGDGSTKRQATEVIAIHFYDHIYGVERAVTEFGTGIAYDPAWSPVSNEIAFVATESGNDEIWTIRHDGTEVRQLTRNDWEWDKHPSWSPDGQQLVFFSNRTGTSQIWIMNKDGSEQRPLMEGNPYNDFNPVWIKYLEPAPPLVRQPDWRFTKPPE
jgi:Tol biopolymer transport system component